MNDLGIIRSVDEMQRTARQWHGEGRRIAFVPTMGYLHEGHVSLLRAARAAADVVVLSIFVNPAQFGPTEDLARYPRDLEGDLAKARSVGCDVAFVPEASDIYPPGHETWVEVRGLSQGLCGDHRPGHFVGVATVVLKLLNMVQPDVAFFGEKDYQQFQVIRRMVRDLNVPVAIVGQPTVREPDGLAMSSRNAYLSTAERVHALSLSRALSATRAAHGAGERDPAALLSIAHSVLASEPGVRVEYVELRDAESLKPLASRIEGPAVLALAAHVGKTRLIDNAVLGNPVTEG